jgi:hypothetical protein
VCVLGSPDRFGIRDSRIGTVGPGLGRFDVRDRPGGLLRHCRPGGFGASLRPRLTLGSAFWPALPPPGQESPRGLNTARKHRARGGGELRRERHRLHCGMRLRPRIGALPIGPLAGSPAALSGAHDRVGSRPHDHEPDDRLHDWSSYAMPKAWLIAQPMTAVTAVTAV